MSRVPALESWGDPWWNEERETQNQEVGWRKGKIVSRICQRLFNPLIAVDERLSRKFTTQLKVFDILQGDYSGIES